MLRNDEVWVLHLCALLIAAHHCAVANNVRCKNGSEPSYKFLHRSAWGYVWAVVSDDHVMPRSR